MPVDAELLPILELLSSGPPLSEVPLEQLRGGSALPRDTPQSVARVTDRTISTPAGELPVRIYQPEESSPLPVLAFFHGGGFVLGDLDTHDSIARALARGARCVVVSVHYRRAPEHRFPAAVDDSLAALRWVDAHAEEIGGDAARIAVGGDSAGGNLATVSALRARDEGGPALAAQLLIYPVTQLRAPLEGSMLRNREGYFLGAREMAWFEERYLAHADDARNPHASPLLAADLRGLPPALVITAEFDPLCDQGEAYARRLRHAGVACAQTRFAGAIHGFYGMPVAIGRRAVRESCEWLNAALEN